MLRDIEQPNFAINPDFISYVAALGDGRVLTGPVQSGGDRLVFGDDQGRQMSVTRDEIDEMRPTSTSILPEGIAKKLGPARLRDLLTFLLTEPPHMPRDDASPGVSRGLAEVQQLLAGAPPTTDPPKPLRIVLVAGPKDHGPGEHDYPAWQRAWSQLLSAAEATDVRTPWKWPSDDDFAQADVLVFYQHGGWQPDRAKQIDQFLAPGRGIVLIHYAVDGGKDPAGLASRTGLAWDGNRSKFRHGPLELRFAPDHPITRNFGTVRFHDESYWQLVGDPNRVGVLATGIEEDTPQPLVWTTEPGPGRVFVSILGHYSKTFDDPLFRILVLRGIAWAARAPVDRFNALVLPGASVAHGTHPRLPARSRRADATTNAAHARQSGSPNRAARYRANSVALS